MNPLKSLPVALLAVLITSVFALLYAGDDNNKKNEQNQQETREEKNMKKKNSTLQKASFAYG